MKTVTTTVKEGSPMTVESRIFSVAEYVQPSEGEPIRSVVLETRDSIIVVWHVHPGQEIAAHIHPHGQDTWTVLSGMADYFQGNGIVRALREGEIAVASARGAKYRYRAICVSLGCGISQCRFRIG